MNVNVLLKARSRFGIVLHGATAPLVDNWFTPTGTAFLASAGPNTVSLGVSESGAPPGPSGIGESIRGSTTLVSAVTSRNLTPDSSGNLLWRKTYRYSFPADAGYGLVTLRQGLAGVGGGPLTGGITSGIVAAALLADREGGGSIVVDMAAEGFDMVWEYSEYFPPEFSGIIEAQVVDGSGVVQSTSNHSYTIRPANLNNITDPLKGWAELTGTAFPSLVADVARIKIGLGTIGDHASEPSFTESFTPESVTPPPATIGATNYPTKITLSFDNTTSTGLIDCAQVMLGHSEWQIAFNPPIAKNSHNKATISLNLITG